MIVEYLASQERTLTESFKRIRKAHNDSDVKGSANEGTVADFLRDHIVADSVVTNVQIIDSTGASSSEIDVCICNNDQPFAPCPGQIVIAEGVDFVVQVKAILSTKEIARSLRNCESVKRLIRKTHAGDMVYSAEKDIPHYVDRIPYFIIAFESELKLESAAERLYESLQETPLENQPDALFILNQGVIFNFRTGEGFTWLKEGVNLTGLFALRTDRTLTEFLTYILRIVPRFTRFTSPLLHYLPHEQTLFYLDSSSSP